MKKLTTLIIMGIVIFSGTLLTSMLISTNNEEVVVRTKFEQKLNERKAFYDKMWKTLSQKGQIALKNDSSFQKNVIIIMQGRKDSPSVFMKWITETNPNANYEQVAKLYESLSQSVEAQRDGFFETEKILADIKRTHDNLLRTFPSNIFFSILGRQQLAYEPISSERTDNVFLTGKDNDIKVF